MNLGIITAAELSATAAIRWKNQYWSKDAGGTWLTVWKSDSEAIYKSIVAANGDPKRIADAIGNQSWSYPRCDVCQEYPLAAVQLGSDEITTVCLTCLNAAQAALQAVTNYQRTKI